MLDTISGDRLRDELELVFKEEYPEYILKKLEEIGLLQVINSSLKYQENICEGYRKARSLNNITSRLPSLYLCLLIYPLNKQELNQFIDRLNIREGLFEAIDIIPKFIRRNTRMASKIESMKLPCFICLNDS